MPVLNIMTVSTVMRIMKNTSMKSKCIHLLVHVFFGTIIVTSFILILMMTLKGAGGGMLTKCSVSKCRVMCADIDYAYDEESQITIAASEADSVCTSITLAMIRPIFQDGILPENWLSRVRTTIRELSIVEGNLNYITPGAFMNPVSNGIRMLVLDGINMSTWREDTFLGLSSLRELYIKDCSFGKIKDNALEAVDDTLLLLDVKATHFWNPANVTGTTILKVEKVNLSFNIFYDILNNGTLQSLRYCKILYLNSCKITFIGAGTFHSMKSLELLYLNDNHLVTIPPRLFEPLLSSETIRIALHENFWLCSCGQKDLRTLHTKGAILVEPVCYYPDIKRGITFSELEEYCNRKESSDKPATARVYDNVDICKKISISTIIQNKAGCYEDRFSVQNNAGRHSLPSTHHTCLSSRMRENVYKQIIVVKNFVIDEDFSGNSTWLRPVYTSHSLQYSMIELSVTGRSKDGIMWYESDNKSDVYCINSIPDVLQVFYSNVESEYTFCLFDTTTGDIQDKCLKYKLSDFVQVPNKTLAIIFKLLIHTCTAFACLLCGATCVFVIINKNPTLLKRNKRILLVKHKTIDALVLPPEVPLRRDKVDAAKDTNDVVEKIFVVPQNELHPYSCYERSTSMRSSESNDASYISALSPTGEQLRDWRSNSMVFDRSSTTDGDVSPICGLYESLPYYSLHEKVYETIH